MIDKKAIRAALCANVRKYRLKLNMTQEELGQRIGYTKSYISFVENGQRAVSIEGLVDLCDVFEITPNDLLQYSRSKSAAYDSGNRR